VRPFYPLAALLRQTALRAALFAGALASWAWPASAQAQSLIRDAEIERTLRSYADPVFAAAGLNPKDVSIYIVNDPQINAFVAEGQNLFINTGTIMQLDRPRELIGIIAHETGHMAGGHLVRSADALDKATVPLILGTLLGAAAMAAGGGEAGAGIMMEGQNLAQRSLLAYSREQESKADQAAVTYLDKTHQSARGLLDTFAKFRQDEILSYRRIDPFLQNHPLSDERIAALEDRVDKSPYKDAEETPAQKMSFARIKAKLYGFINRLDLVLRKYPIYDKSVPARYARAIAYYRVQQLDKAFGELDPLIAAEPDNPYFHELKGQILLENQHIAESIPEHRRSVELLPGEPLLKVNLGQALVATEDPRYGKEAVAVLEQALRQDPDNTFAWDQVARAYAVIGQIGMAELATAEKFYRAGGEVEALPHAMRALCSLDKNSPAGRRAQDIVATTRAQAELAGDRAKRQVDGLTRERSNAQRAARCQGYGDLDGGDVAPHGGGARRG
jgi:predicted Zn-dependent protease